MILECINPAELPAPPTYTQVIVATGSRGVATLGRPEYLIEVEAIAVTDG